MGKFKLLGFYDSTEPFSDVRKRVFCFEEIESENHKKIYEFELIESFLEQKSGHWIGMILDIYLAVPKCVTKFHKEIEFELIHPDSVFEIEMEANIYFFPFKNLNTEYMKFNGDREGSIFGDHSYDIDDSCFFQKLLFK
jgi:hypothetical protein